MGLRAAQSERVAAARNLADERKFSQRDLRKGVRLEETPFDSGSCRYFDTDFRVGASSAGACDSGRQRGLYLSRALAESLRQERCAHRRLSAANPDLEKLPLADRRHGHFHHAEQCQADSRRHFLARRHNH